MLHGRNPFCLKQRKYKCDQQKSRDHTDDSAPSLGRPKHAGCRPSDTGAYIVKEKVERRSLRLIVMSAVSHPAAGDGVAAEKSERHDRQAQYFEPHMGIQCQNDSGQGNQQREQKHLLSTVFACHFCHPDGTEHAYEIDDKNPADHRLAQ